MDAILEALNDTLTNKNEEIKYLREENNSLFKEKEALLEGLKSANKRLADFNQEVGNLKKLSNQREIEALAHFEVFLTNLFKNEKIEGIKNLRAAFPMLGLVRAKEIYEEIENKFDNITDRY